MSWEIELEKDLKWREDELAALRFAVTQTTFGTVPHKALLRALWAMLYAHYEGFCLYALSVFLDNVKRSGVARNKCKEPLMIISLEHKFTSFRREMSTQEKLTFCSTMFPTIMAAAIDFELDKQGDFVMNGRCNLYAKHLLDHCQRLCLTETCIEANKDKLGLLVTRRNAIAHGESVVVRDLDEYKQYEDAAIDAMHDLAVAIVDALDKKSYVRVESS